MFLKGAGHIDGEILETLWASFNKISPSARSMTLAHRQELYDDHMRDSNWKKLVGIVKTLLRKLKAASNGVESMKGPFEELSSALDTDKLRLWTKNAEKADNERGEALDVYNLQMDKAPTLAEMRLNLLNAKTSTSGIQSSVIWLIEGFSIEDAQDALRADIRCLPINPSTTQKANILQKQQRLYTKIAKFNQMAQLFMSDLDINVTFSHQDDPAFCPKEKGENLDDEERERAFWGGLVDEDAEEDGYEEDPNESLPEDLTLWMPSYIGASCLKEAGLEDLVKNEVQLRTGQANDSLDKLRTHLGHKAILYRMNFQSSTSVRTDTRSKQDIRRVALKITRDVQSYHRARESLSRLEASQDILQKTLLKKIGWVKVQTFFLGSGELEEASLGHLVYGMRNFIGLAG
ncbi:hypothetical protein V8E52_011274 [Russula decolorans]